MASNLSACNFSACSISRKAVSNIMEPTALMPLKVTGISTPRAFSITYRNAPVYAMTARAWIDSNSMSNPIRAYFEKRWAERKEPLWWCAVTFKTVRSPKTIRSSMNRRMRFAFIESLRKRGYAKDGNRLPGAEPGPPLTGTVQFLGLETLLTTKMDDLVAQMDRALQGIIDNKRPSPRSPKPQKPGKQHWGKVAWGRAASEEAK